MSDSACCRCRELNATATGRFSLREFVRLAFRKRNSGRRRRLAVGDLPPELLRDIGFDEEPRGLHSLEEKWRLELELRSK